VAKLRIALPRHAAMAARRRTAGGELRDGMPLMPARHGFRCGMVRTGRDICTARRILLAVATVTVSGSPVPSGTPDCLADYVPN
jgi:hypothetical protein